MEKKHMYSSSELEEKRDSISLHFSQLAKRYGDLRITDAEPVVCIARELELRSDLPRLDVADIGCGDGRYSLLLTKYLDGKVRLRCIDSNEQMLETLTTHFNENGMSRFVSVKSAAETLPFDDDSFDCIMTFNAVHHFKLSDFLVEAARILRDRSLLFIYTRTPEQNSRNIWGQYFPEFCQKETNLYDQDGLEQAVNEVPALKIKRAEHFKYEREASLERLIEKAGGRHYSTFWYYSDDEFGKALDGFRQNLVKNFSELDRIQWFDENLLLVVAKEE